MVTFYAATIKFAIATGRFEDWSDEVDEDTEEESESADEEDIRKIQSWGA